MHPRFLSLALFLGLAAALRAEDRIRPATADEVVLLKEALKNTQQEPEHWAYTETTAKKIGIGKKPKGETVVRFDPSQPYGGQFTPLKVEGRAPSERDLKKYRERGEKRGEGLARAAARAADPTTPEAPAKPVDPSKKKKEMKADLEHPRIVREEEGRLVYDLPLVANTQDIPVDKFELRLVVNRATRQVEHGTARVLESFRVKIVKVKAGEGRVDFAVVDPKFGPVMTAASGNVGASLLFVPVNATFASTRTEFRRVKPFNERLQVKLGPLELLDF